VLDEQELTFRTTDELQIEGLFFSTFFGGGDSSWATPKDVYIDFAEFEVSRVEAADGGSENEASASDSQDNSDPPISEQSPLTVAIMEKSDWADGFCMDIEVTNWSNVTVEDWQVTFQMNQADVQKTWSGDIERQGALYVATPGDWSREIEPGKTEDIGFCADKLGSDYQPRQVSVSGT
jgi:cellulase/cellobiase CelA1